MPNIFVKNCATVIPFDIKEGGSQIVFKFYIKRFADMLSFGDKPTLIIMRPANTTERGFDTYLVEDKFGNL